MKANTFQVHAFITLSNTGGIEIMLNSSEDGVYYRWNYGQPLDDEEIYEAEILFDQDGEAYFIHVGVNDVHTSYYLNQAMRVR